MLNDLFAIIVDESKWLTASMGIALLAVVMLYSRHRGPTIPRRRQVLAAMNLFFGLTIGIMALGHLLAVTTKLGLGTLEGPVVLFYVIGVALALPSWWLAFHTRAILEPDRSHGRRTLALNVWLALTLLVLGPQNLPLAAPGAFNVVFHLHRRPVVGRTIVTLAIIVNLGLFVGSLVFLASGGSFEDFSGMR